ncbi:hypothetical protein B0T21DRAFT_418095 [Apiosordaria backusii]|uniref:Uncharacterized protein n=1 Tax=Apiosordaria backusii TaxID=314023 RepID=A0AA40EY08_9PEZI|nr:hypothetical protein B0T21DRAFT_418095 [Apiosordaria backusii]
MSGARAGHAGVDGSQRLSAPQPMLVALRSHTAVRHVVSSRGRLSCVRNNGLGWFSDGRHLRDLPWHAEARRSPSCPAVRERLPRSKHLPKICRGGPAPGEGEADVVVVLTCVLGADRCIDFIEMGGFCGSVCSRDATKQYALFSPGGPPLEIYVGACFASYLHFIFLREYEMVNRFTERCHARYARIPSVENVSEKPLVSVTSSLDQPDIGTRQDLPSRRSGASISQQQQ